MPIPFTSRTVVSGDNDNACYVSFHFSRQLLHKAPLPPIDVKIGISVKPAEKDDATHTSSMTDVSTCSSLEDTHEDPSDRISTDSMAPAHRVIAPGKSCLKTAPSVTRSSSKKQVVFGEISIRRYNIILGNHPGCSDGVTITLDWAYTQQPVILLDDYQDMRGAPRTPKHFYVSPIKRSALLAEAGYGLEELREQKKAIKRIQQGRVISAWLYPVAAARHKMKQAWTA